MRWKHTGQGSQDDGRSKTRFPQGLDYIVALDTTLAVSAGIDEIKKTLIEALLLVILGGLHLSSGLESHPHPAARSSGFTDRNLRGISTARILHQHAVALRPRTRLGLVVDDAIVVVEAVEHHIEKGLSPHDATVKAMEEVSGPVIAIALILAAVSFQQPSFQELRDSSTSSSQSLSPSQYIFRLSMR